MATARLEESKGLKKKEFEIEEYIDQIIMENKSLKANNQKLKRSIQEISADLVHYRHLESILEQRGFERGRDFQSRIHRFINENLEPNDDDDELFDEVNSVEPVEADV